MNPYKGTTMLYIVQFEDKPNMGELRDKLFKSHIEFLDKMKDKVLVPGSMREVPSDKPLGGLWIIEANTTYRGWFTGGNQAGEWGNAAFVAAHVAGHGALGELFAALLNGTIKMGDSPSVGYLLHGTPDDPSQPGWGGKFVRVWDGRKTTFDRLTTASDQAEAFGVVEFALPVPTGMTRAGSTQMIFDGRIPAAGVNDGRLVRFRFSPRDAKVWPYVIRSDVPGLDGLSGAFTATPPAAGRTRIASTRHPHWWIDDPDPAAAEGPQAGAKHVSRWREAFLGDFAVRLARTKAAGRP